MVCVMSLSTQKGSSFTFCKESATMVRYVLKCPTDRESWETAAKSMNCETIKQNCSSTKQHQFQYHCVINELRDALLEVCALNRTIFGYCSEYNTMGNVIQEHYYAECTEHDVPCPSFYNSAESYKYQKCYQLVKRTNRKTEYETNLKTHFFFFFSSKRFHREFILIYLCMICKHVMQFFLVLSPTPRLKAKSIMSVFNTNQTQPNRKQTPTKPESNPEPDPE